MKRGDSWLNSSVELEQSGELRERRRTDRAVAAGWAQRPSKPGTAGLGLPNAQLRRAREPVKRSLGPGRRRPEESGAQAGREREIRTDAVNAASRSAGLMGAWGRGVRGAGGQERQRPDAVFVDLASHETRLGSGHWAAFVLPAVPFFDATPSAAESAGAASLPASPSELRLLHDDCFKAVLPTAFEAVQAANSRQSWHPAGSKALLEPDGMGGRKG
ncbi:hypothetical protein CDD83_9325 [Cordyceps sp. RAO-2017]|nr:hypothetical protein CDD83_9325 [Cordyceps sp. RAO-2017]